MRILAFETSAKAGSVALLEDGRLLGEYYLNCGMTHSRTLLKLAEDLLAACELAPAQLDAVACAAGPGSFTGVRIGVAAAKGFAWGAEKPCIGVSTLEAMAHQAQNFVGVICCAMDARRGQLYNALFTVLVDFEAAVHKSRKEIYRYFFHAAASFPVSFFYTSSNRCSNRCSSISVPITQSLPV